MLLEMTTEIFLMSSQGEPDKAHEVLLRGLPTEKNAKLPLNPREEAFYELSPRVMA